MFLIHPSSKFAHVYVFFTLVYFQMPISVFPIRVKTMARVLKKAAHSHATVRFFTKEKNVNRVRNV